MRRTVGIGAAFVFRTIGKGESASLGALVATFLVLAPPNNQVNNDPDAFPESA